MRAFLAVLCCVAVAYGALPKAKPSLRYVVAAWRHGDRTPTGTFPTDPNQEDKWLRGWGALTKVGMREARDLGRMFRDRYADFLNPVFMPDEIYVAGDQIARTIQTGQGMMNGLYPPTPDVEFFPGTTWFPTPVFERPDDPTMFIFGNCPNADKLYNELFQTPELLKAQEDNKDFIDMVRMKTGAPMANGVGDALTIFSPLVVETVHNDTNPRPAWVTDEIYDKLYGLFNKAFAYYFTTRPQQKARIGLQVGEINRRLLEAAAAVQNKDAPVSPTKFYGFSVHDHNVLALRAAHKVFDGIAPPYTGAVVYELHENNGQFTVEMYYKTSLYYEDSTGFAEQKIPCPSSPCTLTDFLAITADIALPNLAAYKANCGLPA